jgi:hypothetical protein
MPDYQHNDHFTLNASITRYLFVNGAKPAFVVGDEAHKRHHVGQRVPKVIKRGFMEDIRCSSEHCKVRLSVHFTNYLINKLGYEKTGMHSEPTREQKSVGVVKVEIDGHHCRRAVLMKGARRLVAERRLNQRLLCQWALSERRPPDVTETSTTSRTNARANRGQRARRMQSHSHDEVSGRGLPGSSCRHNPQLTEPLNALLNE